MYSLSAVLNEGYEFQRLSEVFLFQMIFSL